jgi:predicted acylesterase/phospholipase RssA
MVDGPSGAERQLKALKAAGTSAGAIFFAVGAKAFNAPEITALAVEKIKEKKNSEDVKIRMHQPSFSLFRPTARRPWST